MDSESLINAIKSLRCSDEVRTSLLKLVDQNSLLRQQLAKDQADNKVWEEKTRNLEERLNTLRVELGLDGLTLHERQILTVLVGTEECTKPDLRASVQLSIQDFELAIGRLLELKLATYFPALRRPGLYTATDEGRKQFKLYSVLGSD